MVNFTMILHKMRKNVKPRKFLDTLDLVVKGGHGGNGFPKIGGIGGQGGAIVFEGKKDSSLREVWKNNPTRVIQAGNGEDSSKTRMVGKRGTDVYVKVPTGLTVIDTETGKVIKEINEEETVLIAGGGTGGCVGTNFIGHKGHERKISLDLKLIADVSLVGFPNAGKSTFLKAISNAKPKIASYPFTTIAPQIGVIEYPDYRQITLADLPGLIEGAHKNVGMGHQFLKHIERTKLLTVIIDIFGFQLSQKYTKRNCLETLFAINKELEMYDERLLEKPAILLVNKMDLDGSVEEFQRYENIFHNLHLAVDNCSEEIRPRKLLHFERVMPISAKCVKEIETVKEEIRYGIDVIEKVKFDFDAEEHLEHKLREFGPKIV